jgi:predicted secreted Zn-dependent protease
MTSDLPSGPNEPPRADLWACEHCGFSNLPYDEACFICHRSRLRRSEGPDVPQRSVGGRRTLMFAAGGLSAAIIVVVGAAFALGTPQATLPTPAEGVAGNISAPSNTPFPTDAEGTHTVRPGDTLFGIASALGVSEEQLLWWNLDGHPSLRTNPRDIVVGWVLITAGEPMPTPTPRPTPEPTPIPTTPVIPDFFNRFPAGVVIVYYEIAGDSPSALSASMRSSGPWSEWLDRRAAGETRADLNVGAEFHPAPDGSCQVVATTSPAVGYRFTVTLPHWSAAAGADPSTVRWWTSELDEIATHEAHHVVLYQQSLPALNEAVASSSCSTLSAQVNGIVSDTNRQNCVFDLEEYGYALGLTLDSCLTR